MKLNSTQLGGGSCQAPHRQLRYIRDSPRTVGWSVLGPSRDSSKASSLRITVYPISGKEALSPGPPVHQHITSTESRRQERQIRPAYQGSTGPLVLSPTRSHGALQPHHQNRRTIWNPSRSITPPRLRSSPTRSRRQRHGRSVATCGPPSRPKLLPKDHPHLDHPPQLAPRVARLASLFKKPAPRACKSLCPPQPKKSAGPGLACARDESRDRGGPPGSELRLWALAQMAWEERCGIRVRRWCGTDGTLALR